jgi:signal transduction histidine kinase
MDASYGLQGAAAPFGKMKILIVDDDPTNVALLEEMLTDNGYTRVKSIMDSRLALDACRDFAPDLVLLDLKMPHVDGFTLLDSLRSGTNEKFLPIIILTADVNRESKRRALRAGATDFLLKPFDQTEVLLRMGLFMERRNIEDELRRQKESAETANAAKDHLVGMLKQELECQKENAEAARAAKDRFLAMLSHELRTPLTPVLFWASGTSEEPNLNTEIRDGLKMICRNVELEVRLIDDLLELSRISRGKLKLQLRMADLHEVLQHAVDIVRNEMQDRPFEFSVALDASHRELLVDAPRLQQVFWSLLRNACKFTPEKGAVSVRSYNSKANTLTIEISDNGIGIAPQFLEKIFGAFEQVDSQREGLGLGLAISKAVIEMHGGAIRARSEGLGKGATFIIELPANQTTLGRTRAEETTEPANPTKHCATA